MFHIIRAANIESGMEIRRMNDYWEGKRDWGPNHSAEESAKNVKDEQKHIYLKSFSEDENSGYMWKK